MRSPRLDGKPRRIARWGVAGLLFFLAKGLLWLAAAAALRAGF